MSPYVFDNAWQQARQRLAWLEQCLDRATCRRLSALGVAQGWQQARELILAAGATQETLDDVQAELGEAEQWFTGPAIKAAWVVVQAKWGENVPADGREANWKTIQGR